MALPRSALPSIWSRVSPASLVPTTREVISRIGKSSRHSRVTCQLSASIAMPTTTTEIELETVLDSVDVKARWAPITSLLSRDTSAPVWVRVKNARLWRCTWPKTCVRRSKIRPSPMREENQPASTARAALTIATPAMARASRVTRVPLPAVMPSSTRRCTSSGLTTTRHASIDRQQQEDRDQAAGAGARTTAPGVRSRGSRRAAPRTGPCACGGRPPRGRRHRQAHHRHVTSSGAAVRCPERRLGLHVHMRTSRRCTALRRASRGRGSPRSTGPRPRRGAAGPGRARGLARPPRRG